MFTHLFITVIIIFKIVFYTFNNADLYIFDLNKLF